MEPNPGSSLQWSGSVNTRCFVLLAVVTRSGAKRHKHGSGILELATWVGDERWLLEFVPGVSKSHRRVFVSAFRSLAHASHKAIQSF